MIKEIDVKKIENKLKIIAWLENLRWECAKKNKCDLIAYYCKDDLFNFVGNNINSKTAEAILLTHYLVYICDRQMPYEDIFKAGGYTISTLVKEFIRQREDIGKEGKIRERIRTLIDNMVKSEKKDNKNDNSGDKYSYYLCTMISENEKEHIKKYFKYKSMGRRAKFSSRFMITDLLCIYRTLVYLCEKFDGSFLKFLNYAIGNNKYKKPIVYNEETKNRLYSLAYSMYRLTYQLIPQVKGNKEYIREILKQEVQGIIGLNKEVKKYLSESNKNNSKKIEMSDDLWLINSKAIANEYSFDKKKHDSKRLWCVARDFVYHPLFSKCFEIVTGEDTKFLRENNAGEFELPGDVWNNNLKFAQCFWFGNEEYDNNVFKNIQKSSKFVRNLYNKNLSDWKENNEKIQCYPKDFDITFNFVPNMCAKDKCDKCPLSNNGKFNLEEYCHKQKEKLCAFILYATGLEYICEGEDSCELLKLQNSNSNKIAQ